MGQTKLNARQAGAEGAGNIASDAEVTTAVNAALVTAAADATSKANAAIAASAPIAHVGSGGSTHAVVVAGGTAGFMSGADKTKLNAITGTNTGDQTTITGNAGSATVLQTARTINGVSFNGSANITINAVDSTARVASSLLGTANGVATLGADSKILTSQLPSFVDDVHEFVNLAGFPGTGETGKIYVALDTNKTYRWSGSVYVYITSGAVDSVAGKTGIVSLVKADVGLSNVDNTSDATKPVSTPVALELSNRAISAATDATNKADAAQAAAIAASAPIAHVGSNGSAHTIATTVVNGFMSNTDKVKLDAITGTNTGDQIIPTTLPASDVFAWAKAATKPTYTKAEVGLGSVDNTADSAKPISTAQQTALNTKPNWTDVGAPNGLASLGTTSKLLDLQYPFSIIAVQVPATSGTTLIPYDNTTPLITEGTQIASINITPISNNSKLFIAGNLLIDSNTANRNFVISIFRGTTCIGVSTVNFITIARPIVFSFSVSDLNLGASAGSSVNYTVRIGVNAAATWYVNRMAALLFNNLLVSNSIVFKEFV